MHCGQSLGAEPTYRFCPYCGQEIPVAGDGLSSTDPYLNEALAANAGGETLSLVPLEREAPENNRWSIGERTDEVPEPESQAASAATWTTAGAARRKNTEDREAASKPATGPDSKVPGPDQAGVSEEDREFSETAWFMAAVSPELLEDGEALDYSEQDRLTSRYEVSRRLPTDARKGFSLEVVDPADKK